jgi:hypothetical protein
MWFFLLFRILGDVFRSDDLSGWGKAAWLIFLLVVPFLGVLVSVIARGDTMGQRDVAQAQAQNQAFQAYVRDVAGTGGSADQLAKLADLRDRGVVNDENSSDSTTRSVATCSNTSRQSCGSRPRRARRDIARLRDRLDRLEHDRSIEPPGLSL